ncbi:lipid phosphate phosphatase delta [Senna tora]|uniref:Lipid phosphate phosphatase delta n=1 Tax=Senna tora TaxID=362788 RepID=A0A834SVB6_9FABA|nr:lipid phosphate phosphatase delta [Senna tora]
MEGAAMWQGTALAGILLWIVSASYFDVTRKLRSLLQPWVTHHVVMGTPIILRIQSYRLGLLDALFSGLSCVVSVPFYTGFLPLLFWSGHGKLARQMTLLMAFCDYIGNCIKDVTSAPRPASPPVRRVTATKDEEENSLEYGLPSSHTLNTVCLSGYLLHYVLTHTENQGAFINFLGVALACLLVGLIGFGRIYLGMHSVIDVYGGLLIGLGVLAFWLAVAECIDSFVVSGQNVTSFWAALSFLLLFAYPTPELPTPSFEYHTAFNGVALGIVAGIQQTYHQFHHDSVPRFFISPDFTIPGFVGRILVGIPTILIVKFCLAWSVNHLSNLSKRVHVPTSITVIYPERKSTGSNKKATKTIVHSESFKNYIQHHEEKFPSHIFDIVIIIKVSQSASLPLSWIEFDIWMLFELSNA